MVSGIVAYSFNDFSSGIWYLKERIEKLTARLQTVEAVTNKANDIADAITGAVSDGIQDLIDGVMPDEGDVSSEMEC